MRVTRITVEIDVEGFPASGFGLEDRIAAALENDGGPRVFNIRHTTRAEANFDPDTGDTTFEPEGKGPVIHQITRLDGTTARIWGSK